MPTKPAVDKLTVKVYQPNGNFNSAKVLDHTDIKVKTTIQAYIKQTLVCQTLFNKVRL